MWKQLAAIGFGLVLTALVTPAKAIPPATELDFQSAEIPAPLRDAWDATVLLSTRSWAGSANFPSHETGSGLILDIDDQRRLWIATSAHVVPCAGRCLIRVYLPPSSVTGRTVSTSAEIVWRDADQDLALLRCTLPLRVDRRQVAIARPANGPLVAGTRVVAIGFPDLQLLHPRRSKDKAGKRFSSGLLLGEINHLNANYFSFGSRHAAGQLSLDHALTHDAALLPGSSGGPLVDDQGQVLGINTGSLTQLGDASCAGRREHCNVHLAVPISKLLELTRQLQASP